MPRSPPCWHGSTRASWLDKTRICPCSARGQRRLAAGDSALSYSDVLDALPIVAYMAAPDGTIVYVSRGWTEFTGYARGEILCSAYRPLIDAAHADRVVAKWLAACKAELPYSDEFRLRLRDGSYRAVLSQAAPVRDPRDDIAVLTVNF